MLVDFGVLGYPGMEPKLQFPYEMLLLVQVLKFRALDCGTGFGIGRNCKSKEIFGRQKSLASILQCYI